MEMHILTTSSQLTVFLMERIVVCGWYLQVAAAEGGKEELARELRRKEREIDNHRFKLDNITQVWTYSEQC